MLRAKARVSQEIIAEKTGASQQHVTGQLYMEHVVDNTLQDAIARFKRK